MYIKSTTPVLMIRMTLVAALVAVSFMGIFSPGAVQAAGAKSATEAPAQSGWSYYVKAGDSLSKLARRYSVTVSALAHANGLKTTSYVYVGQRLWIPAAQSTHQTGCASYYYVKHGDTLSKIARWYGANYANLAQANGIWNASHIYVGQRICIPQIYNGGHAPKPHHGYGHYKVKAGDTLSYIAKYHGVSTHYLAKYNGISNVNHIYVGQVLKVPGY